MPAELDGSDGRFRAPLHQCLLEAGNDYEAIEAWLKTLHDPKGAGKSSTLRAYRKEAERLLLWAILERKKPLSSLAVEDVMAFKAFLQAPPARWCGPRHRQRWSPAEAYPSTAPLMTTRSPALREPRDRVGYAASPLNQFGRRDRGLSLQASASK